MRNLVLLTHVAISMITPIFLGLALGRLIDKWLTTNWVFSIILMLMGICAGFVNTYKLIVSTNKNDKKKDSEDEQSKRP